LVDVLTVLAVAAEDALLAVCGLAPPLDGAEFRLGSSVGEVLAGSSGPTSIALLPLADITVG
jgi:hypothetical protein